MAILAGVAWFASAGATAYLAYQQWTVGSVLGSSDLERTGAWNALAAVITVYFGARLIASPTHSLFHRSTWWAILSVLLGVIQIGMLSSGNDAFVISLITAGVAGMLSFIGRQQTAPPPTATVAASQTTPTAALPPQRVVAGSAGRRFSNAEKGVIGLIVLAVVIGSVVLLSKNRVDDITRAVASALPAARVTPVPANAPAQLMPMNEPVPLVDTAGNNLGSVTVLDAAEPNEVLGLPPNAGNRLIVVKVRYAASAPWTYNMFDWALHDATDRQYQPTGLAPDPALSAGTLSPGKNVIGWIGFEVPSAARVWLDYRAADGMIIYSVDIS